MGEHTTWFDLLPGFKNLQHFFQQYLGRSWSNEFLPPQEHFSLVPVVTVLLLALALLFAGLRFRRMAQSEEMIVPPKGISLFTLFDFVLHSLYELVAGVVEDRTSARQIFPLAAGLFLIIFFSNIMGVIPGMAPPTAHLQFNLVLALTVFLYTHYLGVSRHGVKYLKQFTGEFMPLAPLMIVLEVISHIARPISLTIRLLGNIFADHKVIAIFTFLFPLIIPIPFLFLGILVSLIQAFVFTLLAVIYFGMALSSDH